MSNNTKSDDSIAAAGSGPAALRERSEDGAWDKFDYARHLAATLAYLAQRQGDLPGLVMLNSGQQHVVPPAAGERQWHRILKALHAVTAEGRFPDDASTLSLMRKLQQLRGRATVLMVTQRPSHMRLADRIVYLDAGRVVLEGPPDEILPQINPASAMTAIARGFLPCASIPADCTCSHSGPRLRAHPSAI